MDLQTNEVSDVNGGELAPNVSDMPQDWWAFADNALVPLGICDGFSEADQKAPGQTHWLFNRDSLAAFVAQAQTELKTSGAKLN